MNLDDFSFVFIVFIVCFIFIVFSVFDLSERISKIENKFEQQIQNYCLEPTK